MGQRYFLNREDFNYDEEYKNALILKEVLTKDEAIDLIEIQSTISTEITEPITILTEAALMVKNPYRAKGLIFCLAMDDSKCVGYGYGYEDEDKVTFYLDTIGVNPEYRGKKIGTEIKAKLISHTFDNPKIMRVKTITQTDNVKTIYINVKMGFNHDKDNISK